jgi:hypothetical protein
MLIHCNWLLRLFSVSLTWIPGTSCDMLQVWYRGSFLLEAWVSYSLPRWLAVCFPLNACSGREILCLSYSVFCFLKMVDHVRENNMWLHEVFLTFWDIVNSAIQSCTCLTSLILICSVHWHITHNVQLCRTFL